MASGATASALQCVAPPAAWAPGCRSAAWRRSASEPASRLGCPLTTAEESQRFPADCPRNWGCVGGGDWGSGWGGGVGATYYTCEITGSLPVLLPRLTATKHSNMQGLKSDVEESQGSNLLGNTLRETRANATVSRQLQSRSPRSKSLTSYPGNHQPADLLLSYQVSLLVQEVSAERIEIKLNFPSSLILQPEHREDKLRA